MIFTCHTPSNANPNKKYVFNNLILSFKVYHVKEWLRSQGYDRIEVGTVEAFQGKEKRVIIISTVRANCGLFDYDAKFRLGFLVDEKVSVSVIVANNKI